MAHVEVLGEDILADVRRCLRTMAGDRWPRGGIVRICGGEMDLLRWVRNAIQWRPSPRQGSVQPYGGSSCPSHGGRPHPPMAPWPTILNELTEAHWLPTAIDPRTQLVTGAAMPVALPLSDRRTHTRHTMSWGSRLFAVGSRLWPHAQERSKSVMNRGRTFKALHGRQEASQSTIHRALAHHRPFPASGVNVYSELVAKHHG